MVITSFKAAVGPVVLNVKQGLIAERVGVVEQLLYDHFFRIHHHEFQSLFGRVIVNVPDLDGDFVGAGLPGLCRDSGLRPSCSCWHWPGRIHSE